MFFDRVERCPFLAGLVRDRDELGKAEIGVVEGSEFVSFGAIDLGVAFPHHLDKGVLRREDFLDDGGGERIGFLGVIGAEGEELPLFPRWMQTLRIFLFLLLTVMFIHPLKQYLKIVKIILLKVL